MHYRKSPIRYLGGKHRGVQKITAYFPAGLTEMVSPFLGGGNLEMYCAENDIWVYGSDIFEPLMNFWKWAADDAERLARAVESHQQRMTRDEEAWQRARAGDLPDMRASLKECGTGFEAAVFFYILNRCTYGGGTLSAGYYKTLKTLDRFTKNNIRQLWNTDLTGMQFQCCDYREALEAHPGKFCYLDPPYYGVKHLYGTGGALSRFDHQALFSELADRKRWVLSYNNHEQVRLMYEDFPQVRLSWVYGGAKGAGDELLIFSRDTDLCGIKEPTLFPAGDLS